MSSSLVRWLATLDTDRLAGILARRPETLVPPVRDLSELASRLQSRDAVTIAFQSLPLPAAQLVEAMQSIGGPSVTRDRLAAVFGRAADDPELDAVLGILTGRGLLWPDNGPDRTGGQSLRMAGPLWSAFPYPLRLGAPAQQLLQSLAPQQIRDIASALGIPPGHGKKDALRAVCARLADTDSVRSLLDGAAEPVRALLTKTAWHGPLVVMPQAYPGSGRQPVPEIDWAVQRGLLVPDGWRHAQMPAEVALALRGPDWHPPLHPRPPEPELSDADPAVVAREAAAAAGTTVEQVTTLLEICAATPVALLRSGGVGVRELRRLGKAVGCGEPEVRLWLELAYAAGLVAPVREQVLPTEAYDTWRTAEPAGRLVPLLRAWLRLPAAPLTGPGPDGAAPPAALTRDPNGLRTFDLRPQLLGVAAGLPGGRGTTPAAIEDTVRWQAPLLFDVFADTGTLLAGVWREGHLVGALAHGALSPLGRALLDDAGLLDSALPALPGPGSGSAAGAEPAAAEEPVSTEDPATAQEPATALVTVAEQLLPAAVRTAMFQADLTAVVPGVPAAGLATLLDAAADRESRGGAVTWRFSAASVRRALDAGRDDTALLAELRQVAAGGALPQPLAYLIGDVARRHGAIRVRSVGCVLRADDPALLAEVAGARALTGLRLALIAPTVLVSAKPVEETLAALRAAGYAPVGESADGTSRVERVPRRRAPVPRRQPPFSARPGSSPARPDSGSYQMPVEPRKLAAALLAGAAGGPAPGHRRAGGQAADLCPGQPRLALTSVDPFGSLFEVDDEDPSGTADLGPAVRPCAGRYGR